MRARALAKAQAAIASSEAQARRYGELVKINAISRQDYDNAVTSAGQARADVAAHRPRCAPHRSIWRAPPFAHRSAAGSAAR
jgi:multidrug resistance efflux pump